MIEKSLTLLVVDDDKRLRELLEKYLLEQGFWVLTAQSAHQARQRLQEHTVDLIILDHMMPEESGLEFLEKLRTNKEDPNQHIPVLMLTALGNVEEQEKALSRGANDYVVKPFSPKEFISRLKKMVNKEQDS